MKYGAQAGDGYLQEIVFAGIKSDTIEFEL